MLRRILAIAALLAMLFQVCALGEASTEDYSWLDDMTINQLKALDEEIHKRLPSTSGQTPSLLNKPDTTFLQGTWETLSKDDWTYMPQFYGHDLKFSFTFNPGGSGMYDMFDLTTGQPNDHVPCSYKMSDEKTVNVNILFLAQIGFEVREDEAGTYLFRYDTEQIYRKVD